MPPKKLLFVAAEAAFFATHRLPLALAAREHGYEVHIATPAGRLLEAIRDRGFPWHPIVVHRATNMLREIRSIPNLVALYRRIRPDIVHHVAMKAVLYGTLAARVSGVPAVVNAVTGLGYAFDPIRAKSPLGRSVKFAFSHFFHHEHMLMIFQNAEDRETFVRRGWAAENETVLIPGSGVDANVFKPAVEEYQGAPLVVLVARLLFAKGVAEFVEAARILKRAGSPARLAIIGVPDPANPDSIPQEQLDAWGDERVVEIWGHRDDMPNVLSLASIFVLPTYYPEGIPKALIEAAASGLPAITTDTPGCRDIVVDGETGVLVPPRSATAVADAIAGLLADAPKRREMGRKARERVLERFTVERINETTLSAYDQLLQVEP